jgi:hypothetical protein
VLALWLSLRHTLRASNVGCSATEVVEILDDRVTSETDHVLTNTIDRGKGVSRMKRVVTVCLLIAMTLIVVARADIPIQSKESLGANATHIAVGTVTAIYTAQTKDENWVKTTGVVEILVDKLEKGSKIEAGDSVYARFWDEAWIGKGNPPPFGPGHHLPRRGDAVRVFLERKNGGYDALLQNGFETIPKSTDSKTTPRQ